MNLQERMTAFAMLGAEWVMWLLVALSVVGLAVVLERAWVLARSHTAPEQLAERFRQVLHREGPGAAARMLADSRAFEARIVAAALAAAEAGAEAAATRMEGAKRLARLEMERGLAFLGTVGSNAPFVGLLGTVIGVIRAFHELDRASGQVTEGLMAEIGEALVATAIGLLVALPAVAFYNYFQRVVRARLMRADALGAVLLAYLRGDRAAASASDGGAPAAEGDGQRVAKEDASGEEG